MCTLCFILIWLLIVGGCCTLCTNNDINNNNITNPSCSKSQGSILWIMSIFLSMDPWDFFCSAESPYFRAGTFGLHFSMQDIRCDGPIGRRSISARVKCTRTSLIFARGLIFPDSSVLISARGPNRPPAVRKVDNSAWIWPPFLGVDLLVSRLHDPFYALRMRGQIGPTLVDHSLPYRIRIATRGPIKPSVCGPIGFMDSWSTFPRYADPNYFCAVAWDQWTMFRPIEPTSALRVVLLVSRGPYSPNSSPITCNALDI